MITAAQFALTHIASQLLHRWLQPMAPSPSLCRDETAEMADVLAFSERHWLQLIQLDQAQAVPDLSWFGHYQKKRGDRDGLSLARETKRHLSALGAARGSYLLLCDTSYPEALRHLADPPLALSVLGHAASFSLPAISVVGSRQASGWAMLASYDLGLQLADAGFLVVSGGAFGCDIAAHHGVLASRHPAAAACVFAGGLATLYPRSHEPIFRRLREQEALLISERLWSASCRPRDFMARNRLISGLAQVTVLMQAASRSGAMMTARLALDQGRDVAVLRHPADDVRASGSAALLAEGAWGFEAAAELLQALQ